MLNNNSNNKDKYNTDNRVDDIRNNDYKDINNLPLGYPRGS